ncbi:MAG: hypothetical protein AOA66_0787 [Candidatus Bathyarchaeota archaeon BA2]|nr:MAG: hypothetical protein AOA66_0787 [Candidatus Bathyarchaeota archaeon BA2]
MASHPWKTRHFISFLLKYLVGTPSVNLMPKNEKTNRLKQKPENRRKRRNQEKALKIDQKTRPKVPKLKINHEAKLVLRAGLLSKLDNFLSLVKDGNMAQPHSTLKKVSLPTEQLAKISETLFEQGITQYQEARWVRINL